MQARRAARVGAIAGAVGLVATGCFAPFDLDKDGAADVAWVRIDGDHLVLVDPDQVEPADVGDPGSTTWVAGNARGNGIWGLTTIHDDGTWHTESGIRTFPDTVAGDSWPFLLQLDADPEREAVWYHEATGTYEAEGLGTVPAGVPDDGTAPADHDIPTPADYDGDGLDDLAVYRPTDGSWWLAGSATPMAFDGGIGLPAAADYDGDGTAEAAVHDLLTGEVTIDGLPPVALPAGGLPTPADYDGDGADDPAAATTDPTTGLTTVHVAGLGNSIAPAAGDVPWTVHQAAAARLADLRIAAAHPLPLAGTTNFLGTARMGYASDGTSLYAPEGYSLSINGRCTAKVQGDRVNAAYHANEQCTGATNPEYDPFGSYLTIDLPEGRTAATDVLVLDGAYVPTERTTSPALPAPSWFPPDFNPGATTNSPGDVRTRMQLLAPDATPDDPADNPPLATLGTCAASDPGATGDVTFFPPSDFLGTPQQQASEAKDAETNTTFFPTHAGAAFRNSAVGWFNLCRIPASAPAGTYLLRVDHLDEQTRGSNNYAVVARTPGDDRLCARASDPLCPTVGTLRWLNLRGADAGTAQWDLAEVDAGDAGKVLHLELWDPAEGGQAIRLLFDDGSGYAYQRFDWAASNGSSGQNTLGVPVSSYDFNGELVTIEVPIPAGGRYKLEYEYTSSVTDRTTVSADVLPAPSLVP